MADRASASIVIGGTLPQDVIPAFLYAVEMDHGRLDWEGEPVDHGALQREEPLHICAYDLPGGIFDTLEPFCELHGLPFVRSSGGCGGVFGPERVVFAGEGPARHFEMNESEQIVATYPEIADLGSMEAIAAWFASAEFTPPPLQILAGQAASMAEDAENG